MFDRRGKLSVCENIVLGLTVGYILLSNMEHGNVNSTQIIMGIYYYFYRRKWIFMWC